MARIPAKEKILDTALGCFRAYGYPATSVDDIIAKAGVSKGSFYHAFKSKEDLGLAAIERYIDHLNAVLAQGPHRDIPDPVPKALAFVDHVADQAMEIWGQGCLMGSFAVDLAHAQPRVQQKLKSVFARLEQDLRTIFDPFAARLGAGAPSGAELARLFITQVQGAIVLGHAHGDMALTRETLRGFRRYLASLARA